MKKYLSIVLTVVMVIVLAFIQHPARHPIMFFLTIVDILFMEILIYIALLLGEKFTIRKK